MLKMLREVWNGVEQPVPVSDHVEDLHAVLLAGLSIPGHGRWGVVVGSGGRQVVTEGQAQHRRQGRPSHLHLA